MTSPAIYLDFELTPDDQHRRVERLRKFMGLDDCPENFLYGSRGSSSTQEVFQRAYEVCVERGVKLIIIDSLGFAIEGDSEKSSDVRAFQKELKRFEEIGVSVHVLDHQAKLTKGENYKDKKPFGSIYKFNWARSIWQLRSKNINDDTVITNFTNTKQNLGPHQAEFDVKFSFSGTDVSAELAQLEDVPEKELSTRDRILMYLSENERGTSSDISEDTLIKQKTIQNEMGVLKGEELIKEVGKDGRSTLYALTEEGISSLPSSFLEYSRELGNLGNSDTLDSEDWDD